MLGGMSTQDRNLVSDDSDIYVGEIQEDGSSRCIITGEIRLSDPHHECGHFNLFEIPGSHMVQRDVVRGMCRQRAIREARAAGDSTLRCWIRTKDIDACETQLELATLYVRKLDLAGIAWERRDVGINYQRSGYVKFFQSIERE